MSGTERHRTIIRTLARCNNWPPGFDEELISMMDELPGWSCWWRPDEGPTIGGCVAVGSVGKPVRVVEILAKTPRELAELVRGEEAKRQARAAADGRTGCEESSA